ncbi:putative UV-damage endonuclease [Podospora fimiseda]|uniref:UV-damage endonuclease n=1 Tax=Podospora fimiseda TaxID=252190 RepID=A0AAN7H2N5_9PEZI|nr:putative UV-damage endonuclease [Podospora fimiseda]
MARKSNEPTARTASEANAALDTPIRPEVQLRRSGRNIKQKEMGREESESREIQGKIMGIRPGGEDVLNDGEIRDREEPANEGMKLAIEGLVRMERRLDKANKRQKIKVQETHFAEPPHNEKESERDTPKDLTRNLQKKEPKSEAISTADPSYAEPVEEPVVDLPDRGAARPPPINSPYLPLPWKGRLGYACLNTYLRSAKSPVFSSRTCRMASIIDHRHPLTDPSQPPHAVKNRPDKSRAADHALGVQFVQELGLANARDIVKMLRWNDKYNIKFMRLSSEMFPFASHKEHGYKLAPFASEVLAEAGRVAAELGHRLTTHPGQYTQLGSPRNEVVEAAIRDLEYHDEMLSLLKLPEQQDRDAVMILHMGGVFGDKAATLDRFRQNYAKLSTSIKARLVLENDDVAWTVHDLLPICEELNIPLVLDFHHHNIMFDPAHCREGTLDISQPEIMERIAKTWKHKNIKQKMHYSEPCPGAVTPRDRRKHSPRVITLPPCPPDIDLMIEAKDKEQAVFELMRTFKLPGFERINDVIPHERDDESQPPPKVITKKQKKSSNKRKRMVDEDDDAANTNEVGEGGESVEDSQKMPPPPPGGRVVSEEDRGMGGKDNRVYWPPGMEEWLRPKKREVNRKGKVVLVDEGEEDEDESYSL